MGCILTNDRDGNVVTAVTVVLDDVVTCGFCNVLTNSTFIGPPPAAPPPGFVHKNCCGLNLKLVAVGCVADIAPGGFMSMLVGTSEILFPAVVVDMVVVDRLALSDVAKIICLIAVVVPQVTAVPFDTTAFSFSRTGDEGGDDLMFNICGISLSEAALAPPDDAFDLATTTAAFDPFNAELLVSCR